MLQKIFNSLKRNGLRTTIRKIKHHLKLKNNPPVLNHTQSLKLNSSRLLEQIADSRIIHSNGSSYFVREPYHLMVAGDYQSAGLFSTVAKKIEVADSPKVIKHIVETGRWPDILIYVTSTNFINKLPAEQLKNEVEKWASCFNLANQNGVQTAYYSVGTSSVEQVFLPLITNCKCIFTSSLQLFQQLYSILSEKSVYHLPMGFNPLEFNPINVFANFDKNFVGLLAKQAPQVNGLTLQVLNANVQYDMVNRNRYPSLNIKHNFSSADSLKLFNWIINVDDTLSDDLIDGYSYNELLATGSTVITKYSPDVSNTYINVINYSPYCEVESLLKNFNASHLVQHKLAAIRSAFRDSTNFDQFRKILVALGLKSNNSPKKIAIVVENEFSESLISTQTYQEFAVFYKNIPSRFCQYYDFVVFWKDAVGYPYHYLEDMINAFKYTDSDFIIKLEKGGTSTSHMYVSDCHDRFRAMFSMPFYRKNQELISNSAVIKGHGYAIDSFDCSKSLPMLQSDYNFSVIIPIYNNGMLFKERLFPCLAASRYFSQMEILLIDDGSSCGETREILKEMALHYNNIIAAFLPTPPSGSASRPRNHGLAIATTAVVCFIDPDDAIVTGNFDKLWEDHVNYNSDFTSGAVFMVKSQTIWDSSYLYQDGVNYLLKSNLAPKRIQASFIDRILLLKHNIKFLDGAFGEDTLFGLQLLDVVTKIKVLDYACEIYYDDRDSSVSNLISLSYFERHVKGLVGVIEWCENKPQYLRRFLDMYGLNIFETFLIQKVEMCSEKATSLAIIQSLIDRINGLPLPSNLKAKYNDLMKSTRI